MTYIQFLLDMSTSMPVEGSARYAPGGLAPQNAFQWHVVLDSAGRIVVRAHEVIAVAAWRDGAIADKKQIKRDEPNSYQWQALDMALRGELDRVKTAPGPFADARDDAPLPIPPGAAKKTGLAWVGEKLYAILALIVLLGAIAGGLYYWQWKSKNGYVEDGGTCRKDSECFNNNCWDNKCRGIHYQR